MQWLLLILWGAIIYFGTQTRARWLKWAVALGLLSAMSVQLALLQVDGNLTWEAALPLHLCSLSGVLAIPALWRAPSLLLETLCFLSAPSAFLTLFFPAVVNSSHPLLMKAAFCQLHVLLALLPFFFYGTGKPLPVDPRRTLVVGSGYLLFVSLINRIWNTNYLFLRAAPAGTPLQWLAERGSLFYLCALVLLCMLVFSWLSQCYAHFRK